MGCPKCYGFTDHLKVAVKMNLGLREWVQKRMTSTSNDNGAGTIMDLKDQVAELKEKLKKAKDTIHMWKNKTYDLEDERDQ